MGGIVSLEGWLPASCCFNLISWAGADRGEEQPWEQGQLTLGSKGVTLSRALLWLVIIMGCICRDKHRAQL